MDKLCIDFMNRIVNVCLVLVLVMACATGQMQWSQPAECSGDVLRVESDHWEDVTVYLERAGTRQRVGRVGALQDREFCLLPGTLRARISLVMVPLGLRGTRIYNDTEQVPVFGSFSYRLRDRVLYDTLLQPVLWIAPNMEFSTIRYPR